MHLHDSRCVGAWTTSHMVCEASSNGSNSSSLRNRMSTKKMNKPSHTRLDFLSMSLLVLYEQDCDRDMDGRAHMQRTFYEVWHRCDGPMLPISIITISNIRGFSHPNFTLRMMSTRQLHL